MYQYNRLMRKIKVGMRSFYPSTTVTFSQSVSCLLPISVADINAHISLFYHKL